MFFDLVTMASVERKKPQTINSSSSKWKAEKLAEPHSALWTNQLGREADAVGKDQKVERRLLGEAESKVRLMAANKEKRGNR